MELRIHPLLNLNNFINFDFCKKAICGKYMLYKGDLSKIQNLSPVISETVFTEISSTPSTTHSAVVKSAPATWGAIKSVSVSSPSVPWRRRFRPFPISALIIIPVIPVSVMERIFFVTYLEIIKYCDPAGKL